MALSEDEEFELLSLERERASIHGTGPKTLAESAVSTIQPEVQGPPQKQGFLSRLKTATRQMFFPKSMAEVKSLANPNAGQYGLSKLLEEEGKRVGGAVRSAASNLPMLAQVHPAVNAATMMSDALTPSAMQQQMGGEGLGIAARAAIPAIVRGTSKASELLTGTPASNFRRLAEDPAAILPESMGGPMSKNKAGAALGAAEKKAGFVPDTTNAKGMKSFEGKTSPFKSDQGLADSFYERVSKGEQLTPQEALEAYKATSRSLSKMSRKDARFVEMLKFEQALGSELEALSPEYAAAKKSFARAALGDATTNLLPRTQTGKVSIGRMGFNALLFGGGIINPMLPVTAAVSSPVVHGAATAALGAAGRMAPGVMGGAATGFSAILQRARQRATEDQSKKTVAPGKWPFKASMDVPDSKLSEFVQNAKVGTRFTYQGKPFKVVPAKTRDTAGLSKEEKSTLFAFKRLNRGRNTFASA